MNGRKLTLGVVTGLAVIVWSAVGSFAYGILAYAMS